MPFSWWCGPDGTTQEALTSALSADVRAFFCDVLPFVKSVGPDVIVTQSMVIPWGAAAAAALGKPHIWSVCEYGELDHGLHFVEPVAKITAEIETSSDFIFFAVDDIRKVLFSDLSQDRCDVLYRHIEADQFGESAASESGPIRRLGVVGLFGTVVPSKGQADAIEAVAELNARGMPVELVLAGAGQPDYVKKLKQRVQDLGIGELVRFTGFLENPYPVMRACDIVLVCSRREAFGRTAAEAMLMAKPLIYAASGGVAEYVEDGKTGLSYPPGEFKALADGIETLLGDSSLAARLGEAAEIFARATFTRENYGGKFHKKALTLRDAPSRHSNFPKALLPAIQRAAEIQGREIAIAIAEKASLESLLANRVAEVIEAERRIAGYAATLDERNAQLIEAQRRIAALEKSVVERDQELGLYARRIAAMKSSLSWRLTSPFRKMYRPFRGLRTSPWEGKLSAALRHPANSRKRKKYRLVHMPEHAVVESPNPGRRTHLAQKLRAIARYPFSRRLRRDYRKQLHGFVSPALASQASAPSLAALPANCPDASLFRRYVRNAAGGSNPGDFVPLSNEHTSAAQCDVKLVAYYLPQFHPIPENDEWWGKGFTEWRNVTRTFPVFEEHYQPRIPGELGHYDLRLIDTMRRQVELAKQYGISAFCFHFYWFGGQRLLELPIEGFLNNTDLDLQFSLCWANENWSRRWDGGNNELLIAQKHSPEDDIAFIRYLDRYFRDRRYMKVDGKPVLTIYRPAIIPHIKETIARWRLEAREMGYPDLYLIATNSFAFKDYAEYGFDALSEFPPHSIQARQIQDELELASMRKSGPIYSFASLVDIELAKPAPLGTVHPGIMPSWDNSARRPYDGHIFHGSTPALFARWLKNCFERACKNRRGEQFVFLNAWNEWAEGAYLEPDQRYGYAYLAACAAVVGDNSRSLIAPSLPNVSAIIPNYNHGRFLKERIDSILEQRLPVTELIILDDASTDDSRDIIASLTADISVPVKTVLNDTNSGSIFSQWARGISVAEGDLVWICESDDTCDRGFLEALVPYFEDQSVMLAFGRIDFIEEDGRLRPGMDDYMESAGPGYWQAPRVESAYAWFQGPFGVRNVIPNVGGCIFRRQQMRPDLLAELTSYKTCGDWHLYSRIAHGGRIAYDPAAQAYFRQHRTNSSVANFQTESFFEEHIRIAQALRRHYGSGFETMRKMLGHVRKHHRSIFGQAAANEFAVRHSLENILVQERTVTHILIAMYGFQTGGGEVFPIHLANELAKRGYDVSLLIAESDRVNDRIRRMLDPAIPIFTKSFVEKVGVK